VSYLLPVRCLDRYLHATHSVVIPLPDHQADADAGGAGVPERGCVGVDGEPPRRLSVRVLSVSNWRQSVGRDVLDADKVGPLGTQVKVLRRSMGRPVVSLSCWACQVSVTNPSWVAGTVLMASRQRPASLLSFPSPRGTPHGSYFLI
jgi:hypothetical protein